MQATDVLNKTPEALALLGFEVLGRLQDAIPELTYTAVSIPLSLRVSVMSLVPLVAGNLCT